MPSQSAVRFSRRISRRPSPPVAADTPEKTPSGATFTLAKDWALATHDHYVIASPAEIDTFLVFADVAQAKDAADAVLQA